MSIDHVNPSAKTVSLERLSALVDGELEDSAVARACAHWREDAEARSTWHAYQVIGDVLRSDELAAGTERNETFLVALRARLATEPVVLAPEAPAVIEPVADAAPIVAHVGNGSSGSNRARARRWSWMAPSAVAAGFVAVAGAVMVMRPGDSLPGQPMATIVTPTLAPVAFANGLTPVGVLAAPSPASRGVAADRAMIRDARLDRYLAAHKQFAGSSVLGWPSPSLRNANVEVPSR